MALVPRGQQRGYAGVVEKESGHFQEPTIKTTAGDTVAMV